ncbi:MFS transporter [Streptomyces morookaense]|uniref:MFS transporter n=1 Tax=Streptomyces morookaense TaxID=1970 RepID=UPI00340679C3
MSVSRARQNHRVWGTTVVCLGLFLLGLDVTLLNVAVFDLERALDATLAQTQWVVDGYALVLGGTVLGAGAVTERIGRRRCFIAGLAICGVTSVLGATASGPVQAVTSRCGMGAGAALLMPATLSIICDLFPEPGLRRRAIGLWAALGATGAMTGPLVGGWLVQHYSWRAVFWFNVPTASVIILLAVVAVPRSGEPRRTGFDPLGVFLSASGLLCLVWALIESPSRGWTSAGTLTAFGGAAVLLTALMLWEARCSRPMLPLALLRHPFIASGATTLALLTFSIMGAAFVLTLYLRGVLECSPMATGIRLLPLPAALCLGAALAPSAMRSGTRTPVVLGLLVVTAAFAVLAGTEPDSGYGRVAVFQAVSGFGAGLVATAATDGVMASVPAGRAGLGSAINDATRQVGVALGVAVQGSILATVYEDRLTELRGDGSLPRSVLARDRVPDIASTAAQLPAPGRALVSHTVRVAFADTLTITGFIGGGTCLAVAVLAWKGFSLRYDRREKVEDHQLRQGEALE